MANAMFNRSSQGLTPLGCLRWKRCLSSIPRCSILSLRREVSEGSVGMGAGWVGIGASMALSLVIKPVITSLVSRVCS
jgi:hypothetical protein